MTVEDRKKLFSEVKPMFNQGLNADKMKPEAFDKMADYAEKITNKYKGNRTVQDLVLSILACFDGEEQTDYA